MIKRSLLFIGMLCLVSSAMLAQGNMIDGVVWVVGDNAILRSDVEQQRIRAQYEGIRYDGDPYCIIPEQIAIEKLFLHQAKIDSISVSPASVEQQVNAQIDYYLREIGSREKMEEYFKKTTAEIKDELRETVSDKMIVQQVQQSLVQNVKVTPSEVRKFYSGLAEDSIPMVPAMVETQIIMIEPPIPLEEVEQTKAKLREYAERVNSGSADFSMLARLYSDDKESAKQGGELGFVGRASLVPTFAATAFALTEPGQVSRVVETEFGFHIIQLIERRDERVNVRHILLRPRVSSEVKVITLNRLDSISDIVRTGKMTFEQAANVFSSDKNTRMNGGLMSNQQTGSSKFEYQQLPSEVAKIVYNMKPGEISEPFMMYSQELGRDVFAIVKLKAKLPNHRANMTDDYQILKEYCEVEKKNQLVDDWLKKKIMDTYVYISPEWRNCKFEHDNWIKE